MGKKLWRPITKPDVVLKDKRYSWETKAVPEGYYQIRLQADDSLDNDPKDVLTDEFVSVPVLVDGHQPAVARLVHRKARVKGATEDGFSPISGIEFTVDGGPWTPVICKDGLYDEKREEFDFSLPDGLAPGPHAVAVRAYDRSGNMGTAEIHIETK